MRQSRNHLLGVLALVSALGFVHADDAVERSGKIQRGELQVEQGVWYFRDTSAKKIPLQELSHIRFETKPAPLPKAPLTRTLRLSDEQRFTGTLLRVDAKKATFVTSWGQAISLDRTQIVGIEHANDESLLWHDDFENSLQAWRLEGKPALSADRPFYGKSSLLLDAVGQRAERTWKPLLRDGSIRLFFHHSGVASKLRWTIELISEPPRKQTPTFIIDSASHACANMNKSFGTLPAASSWRLFAAEFLKGRLRIFVEDHCLGETALDSKETIHGIRISAETNAKPGKEAGKLWIDEVSVAHCLPVLRRPQPSKDQDIVWLEQGEQLFGRIVSADAETVTLDAKFGKRSLPWSRLRGILFAQGKEALVTSDPEIAYRPGPGFPVDSLRGKLVRWEGTKLIVAHALFGEITIEGERLHTVRMPAK
ncbi:MAG: hypothetical protein EXR98_08440 [Gemmataceae bacterium]|nr:hypothetical protein [Gemmataceae bacterium]